MTHERTDRHYDLPSLHLHTFVGDKRLLHRAFLTGYGWELSSDFACCAMSMTLIHEFNLLAGVRTIVESGDYLTLEQLADALWNVT